MRALFPLIALPLLLLAGCDALTRQDEAFFQVGNDPARFSAANQACAQVASDHISYDLSGMGGTGYFRNRAYNAVYARCMTGLGFAPRVYAENWLPGG